MSGSSLSAAPSIADARTAAHLALGRRLGALDLTALLIYTIASAPDSVLPFLAWQFDMLAPWWQLLEEDLSQRQLISQAVALHRFVGTPFALQSIIANLGFSLASVQEGEASWDGTTWPADEGWAAFRVLISKAQVTPAPNPPASWDQVSSVDLLTNVDALTQALAVRGLAVSAPKQQQLLGAITFFKPERCWLDSVWFEEIPIEEPALTLTDAITLSAGPNVIEAPLSISELVQTQASPLYDTKVISPHYDGHFYHAGITHGGPEPAAADSGITIDNEAVE